MTKTEHFSNLPPFLPFLRALHSILATRYEPAPAPLPRWVAVVQLPVMSDSLWPHRLQHTRPPCPSLSPEVCQSSCPLYQWCHPAISSSDALFSFYAQSFPASGIIPMSAVHIRWLKYWSFNFSISPTNEYSGLISFKIYWFDLAVQGTLRSLLQHYSLKA